MIGAIVFTALGLIVASSIWAVVDDYRGRKRQPPVEMPEWLQGLTHEQLRELLQAKQHKSQPELQAMANNMRALNVVRCEALLVEPQALPFNTGAPEVA
jgi:hypothetical protein